MMSSFSRFHCSVLILLMLSGVLIQAEIEESQELPAHIKTILDQHEKELLLMLHTACDQPYLRNGRNVFQRSWLDGYLIKYGVERVNNARKLQCIIQEHNLDLLAVPSKYLYHLPSRSKKLSSKNYLVIVKKIEQDAGDQNMLNLAQVKQLYKIALLAGHYDLHARNYLVKGGKVFIIDTDKGAMPSARTIKKFKKDRIAHGLKIRQHGGMRMHNDPFAKLESGVCLMHPHYDSEAVTFITAMAKKREAYFQHMRKCSAFLRFFNLA